MSSKKNKTQKKINKKKVFIALTICILVALIGGVSVLAYGVYKDTEAFDAKKLLSSGASVMYDDQGQVLYTYGSEENGTRENITYEDLPQVLVDAVVAAEDSRFFEHNGFDLPRIAKAAMSNLVAGGIRGGGSTITQQLIKKTYFPNAEKTYTRKFSEIILAIQADKALSKEEILTLYLNKIYFGRSTRSIGISSASRYYFDKDVSELTLPEAAMLAGSLNSPYNFDPYYCLNNATKRRNTILNLMVKHGYITQKECDDAKNVKVENMLCSSKITNSSVNAAYVDIVTDEVKKKTGLDPLKTQMNIYTYCNSETQALAAAIGNGEKYDYSDEDMRMGGAVQSSQDGRIIAVIGGRNYSYGDYNYATRKQQPGSSVKPFLDYGLAFENLDWSTGHSINDDDYYNGKFKNWDRQFHGLVTVENALENSWNIPAIKTFDEVEQKIGSDKIKEAMESIGISMEKENIGLASAIGGWSYGISPLEMAGAYATISNNGLYTESHTINYVEVVQTGETFNIDEEIQNNAKQSAYSKASAFMVRQVMLDYTKNGSGNYAYVSGIDNVGAKTGTSNWSSSAKNGLKLEKAMKNFGVELEGKVCMDVGASTGGFTDCMLQNGAVKVYSVDVGHGQLDWKLRNDERVVCMEKTNIRYVTPEDIEEPVDFSSIDVSFISLTKVLLPVRNLLSQDGQIVCLIKPQFEAGREKVGKKGVVRDPAVHKEVIEKVIAFAKEQYLQPLALDFSPIKGPEGNIEYLLYLQKKPEGTEMTDGDMDVDAVVGQAHGTLDK